MYEAEKILLLFVVVVIGIGELLVCFHWDDFGFENHIFV